MALSREELKEFFRPNWKKSFLIIAYFILLGILSLLPTSLPFYILAWPLYILPSTSLIAAILELLTAYVVACIILRLIERPHS